MSLSAQGFTFLRGIKVPVIAGSPTASNVPTLVKPNIEFDAAMLAKLDVGGGDLRFSEDAAGLTQLPCQIVDGLNVVWVLVPSVATGNKIYVWGDKTGESQPLPSAAFGSEAVWGDYEISINTDGSATDSTGNYTPSATGATFTSGGILGSFATLDSDATDNIQVSLAGTVTYPLTFGSWARINTTERTRIVSLADASEVNEQFNIGTNTSQLFQSDLVLQTLTSTSGQELEEVNTATDQTDWCYYVAVLTSSTDRKLYFNGGLELTGTTDLTPTGIDRFSVGVTGDSTPFGFQPIDVARPFLRTSATTANQIAIEYDNQSTTGAWWIAEDAGAAINVTGATQSQTLESPTLTQSHILAVDSLSQLQSIGIPVLTQAHILAVDSLSQNQTLDNAALVVAGALAVQGLSQSQTLQNAELIQQSILAVQSLAQAQTLDSVTLVSGGALGVQGLEQAQSLENVTIVTGDVLAVQGLTQIQFIQEPGITQQHLLFVDDLSQPQRLTIVNFGAAQDIRGVTVSFKDDGINVKYKADAVTVSFR